MDEAKRRKQNDPSFGRTPKGAAPATTRRGLVVSAPMEIAGDGIRLKSSWLDPIELRFALLFWDELVWPKSRSFYIESSPDVAFLESARILNRPMMAAAGGDNPAQEFAKGQIQTYLELENAEPGVWALAQGENSFLFKEGFADAGTGALLELHRAIPIPTVAVPLAEILEFKARRKAELLALRSHLESFVSEIEKSPDKASALQKHVEDIDQACANLLILGKEWQFPVYLSNIKASLSFNAAKFLAGIAEGWNLGKPLGHLAATATAAASGAASIIDIKGDFGMRSMRRPLSPYRYAFHAHQELR